MSLPVAATDESRGLRQPCCLWRALAACAILLLPATGAAAETANQSAHPPPLLLAERYQGGMNVAHYWISEKLDGVRAIWDGKELRFRSGRPVAAPTWFIAALPPQTLDGELWLGRGTFDRLSGIVRRENPLDDEWRQVRYMIFELPDAPGSFSERIGQMATIIARAGVPWLQAIEQFRLADERALQRKLAEIVHGGGEGLMLHRADAPYETGRSTALLKLTPWLDAEARVVAHRPGKGKYTGLTGALEVAMPDGRRFTLGSGLSDAQRRNPPAVGSEVTYRYRELTRNGMPRFPRFLRVREAF